MIIEIERYNEIGELLRDYNHRGTGTRMPSGWMLESICNYSGCLHGGKGDGDANRTQGCIQSAAKPGMRAGTCTTTVEQSKKN